MSCNQGSYKRLGDYIREVDVRNNENLLNENDLFGVSVTKEFIPTHANLVGVQFCNYKVVKNRQFTYISDTSRRGEKVALALNLFGRDIIVSSVYTTFEVDESNLLPEYLMMWFRRPEFDRYARFKSHGSAREVFDWEEMCEVMMPIPSIAEQQRIVDQYNAIKNRIENNRRIIAKLEETAQALYRKMFVDGIDVEHLPDGWRMGTLGEVADFAYGKMPNRDDGGDIPIFSGYAITGYTSEYSYDKSHIVVIARGDAGSGKICLSPDKFFLTNLAIAILLKHEAMKYYLYYHLCSLDTSILRSGSAQAQVTINSLLPFEIMIPNICVCEKFNSLVEPMHTQMKIINKENEKLTKLLSMVMA